MEHELKKELREKLKQAFRDLRTQGIMTRVNFRCCNTCAAYEIWEKARKNWEKDPKLGYAFWHAQNEEDLWERGRLHIAFGSFNDYCDRKAPTPMSSPLSSADVGAKVILALVKQAIRCEWNGDENVKIEVMI